MTRERGEERYDPATHQRFAAREPELPDTARDEGAAQPIKLFEREEVGLGQKRHVLRHAIDAAKIATIGDRDAQIGDCPAEGVDQGRPRCSLTLESEIVLCHDRKRPALRQYSARGSGLRSADGRAPPFHMGILTDMGQSV
jgi:hypothetical protein